MVLVEFENGTFGIREGWLFHRFVDLKHPAFCWARGDRFFKHCTGTKPEVDAVVKVLQDREIDRAIKHPKMDYKIVTQRMEP